MFGCGGGGDILAAEGLVMVIRAPDIVWGKLECVRANGLHNEVRLLTTTPPLQKCRDLLADLFAVSPTSRVYGDE